MTKGFMKKAATGLLICAALLFVLQGTHLFATPPAGEQDTTSNEKVSSLDTAGSYANAALTSMPVSNDTSGEDVLATVNTSILSVDGVKASWSVPPTIAKATQQQDGSITGSIILRASDGQTKTLPVNKSIAKLPVNVKEQLANTKTLANTAIQGYTVNNKVDTDALLTTINTAIASVDGVHATWASNPVVIQATENTAGSLTADMLLTYGNDAIHVAVQVTIPKTGSGDASSQEVGSIEKEDNRVPAALVPLDATAEPFAPETSKRNDQVELNNALPRITNALDQAQVDNQTTAAQLLANVQGALANMNGIQLRWEIEPTITPATQEQTGSIKGVLLASSGYRSENVNVDKTIAKLPEEQVADPAYVFISGEDSTWQPNSDQGLLFHLNGELSKFTELTIDGKVVDPSNYTTKHGSTIISLKPEFLKTLSAGTYALGIKYTDGEAASEFKVMDPPKEKDPQKPKKEEEAPSITQYVTDVSYVESTHNKPISPNKPNTTLPPADDNNSSSKPATVDTGDTTQFGGYLAFAVLSLIAFAGILYRKKGYLEKENQK